MSSSSSQPATAAAATGDGSAAPPVPAPTSSLARDLNLRRDDDDDDDDDDGAPPATIPRLIYGTAWKKDDTAELVYQALRAGFRGVDTAAQPKHYREDLVGQGIRRAIAEGIVSRADLYIQTKFTPESGQDPSDMPYDPSAPPEEQVEASLRSSLANFTFPPSGPDGGQQQQQQQQQPYIDCLVLHSPLRTPQATQAVWSALSAHVPHRVRRLGISNASAADLAALLDVADAAAGLVVPPPAVLQNRFYRDTRWDVPARALCRRRGLVYQSFWTLSGNPRLLKLPCTTGLASRAGVGPEVALYALVLGLGGTSVLDGTRSHMREDLAGVEAVGRWAEEVAPGEWKGFLDAFREYIHEAP
ncbi:uncharacterized protein E0L32_008056 [Thyridium curvatum]|uniref:Uncharacterized protein n=1 Tax=Thyridium curvatum TaxID=1093900 RepID=A0A507B173_9PEZI|nr:uncharacterized protein E0L32_008056 [Thyridium curvatum]TPX11019.1 hypothetical protein E0L32_008056 [Thyridium curvatum]